MSAPPAGALVAKASAVSNVVGWNQARVCCTSFLSNSMLLLVKLLADAVFSQRYTMV
jgi:hypothetical protein